MRFSLSIPASGNDDNCCALLIDADNSALLEPVQDAATESVRDELAARTVGIEFVYFGLTRLMIVLN